MNRLLPLAIALAACTDPDLQPWQEERLQALVMDAPTPDAIDNPVADSSLAAEVGRCMFHDTHLSFPTAEAEPVSCNSCHHLTTGGHDPSGTATSRMANGAFTARNSPSLFNTAWRGAAETPGWGWKAKSPTLWKQNQVPMAGAPHGGDPLEISRVALERYGDAYIELFGPPPALPDGSWDDLSEDEQLEVQGVFDNVARIIEAYVRTLELRDAAFDRAMSGRPEAMDEAQWRGAKLFIGKGFCDECHSGPAFTDGRLHNLGVSEGSNLQNLDPDDGPSVYLTPPLRGVTQTASYMHNGSIDNLWDVLEFYRFGGHETGFLGTSELVERALDDDEIADLEAFMAALDGVRPDAAWLGDDGCAP